MQLAVDENIEADFTTNEVELTLFDRLVMLFFLDASPPIDGNALCNVWH